MLAILFHIVKILPWRRAAVPPLLVLLIISTSSAAELRNSLSYSNCVRLLEKLEKNPGSPKEEWSRAIQSFLSINKTEKNRVIAHKSLFFAGKAALELYRRHGEPEDLDSAVRYLCDFTKSHQKNQYFVEGLKALQEADMLRRKRAQSVHERPTSVRVAHSAEKAPPVIAPPYSGQKIPPQQYQQQNTMLMSQTGVGRNWNQPAYRHAGNPFYTPRNRNRGQDAGSPAPSSGTWTEADISTSSSVPPVAPPGTGAEGIANIKPPVAPAAPPSSSQIATPAPAANEPVKEPQTTPDQTKLTSVAPPAKPDREAEKKHECSAKGYVVVLDPGHGGKDPGAVSQDGTLKEKDITLEVAKAAKRILEKNNPGITVELTRSDDKFMTLDARTAFANKLNADLFISIHCNSDTDTSSAGIETYYLSQARSEKAMKVAATENNLSLAKMTDLQATLLDLMVTSKKTESEELATAVNNSLEQVIPKGHRGVKQAPFYVLLGAKMPAILVECAFVSSTRESKKLHSPEYLNTIAQGLANGAHSYVQGLGEKS